MKTTYKFVDKDGAEVIADIPPYTTTPVELVDVTYYPYGRTGDMPEMLMTLRIIEED